MWVLETTIIRVILKPTERFIYKLDNIYYTTNEVVYMETKEATKMQVQTDGDEIQTQLAFKDSILEAY